MKPQHFIIVLAALAICFSVSPGHSSGYKYKGKKL
jgi:hypothetical protein